MTIREEINDLAIKAEAEFPGKMRGILQRTWRWQADGTRYSNEDLDVLFALRSQYEGCCNSLRIGIR